MFVNTYNTKEFALAGFTVCNWAVRCITNHKLRMIAKIVLFRMYFILYNLFKIVQKKEQLMPSCSGATVLGAQDSVPLS